MEKFKACEKEMKTKAFSKEGLIQSAKLDPKAQEKLEVTTWLQSQVEDLLLQVEQAEAEIETLQGGGGKKRGKGSSSSAGRLEDLEHLNDRRKWHVNRLELILRLLDNGSLTTDRVQALKEDVQYFVESNTVRCAAVCSTLRPFKAFSGCRTRTSTNMRASTTNLILKKKKSNSVWLVTTMKIVTSRMSQVMVCIRYLYYSCEFDFGRPSSTNAEQAT
jgi:hypothetical protein